MLKRIANLLEDKSLYIAIVLTFLIAYLSIISLKIEEPKIEFGYFDKVAHTISYIFLTLSWFLAFSLRKVNFFKSLLIAISISFYGIIIEMIQGKFTSNREADIYDVLANTIGILLGFGIFILWIQKRKVLK
ncbi:MAG: VanZ family protein [Flavobacteriaceae bacterium]|nr:VanZ family protein [Flavobacteriaceae bacterium]